MLWMRKCSPQPSRYVPLKKESLVEKKRKVGSEILRTNPSAV